MRARRAASARRASFAGATTSLVTSTSAIPASTNASASSVFWQQMPTAPRAICARAIAPHLCDLACGRSRSPARRDGLGHRIEVALEGREIEHEGRRLDRVEQVAGSSGQSLRHRPKVGSDSTFRQARNVRRKWREITVGNSGSDPEFGV